MKKQLHKLKMRSGKIEDWFIGTQEEVVRHAKKMMKKGYKVISICTGGKVKITCS